VYAFIRIGIEARPTDFAPLNIDARFSKLEVWFLRHRASNYEIRYEHRQPQTNFEAFLFELSVDLTGKGQKPQMSSPLYGDGYSPLMFCAITRDASGHDLSSIADKLLKKSIIFVIDNQGFVFTKTTGLPFLSFEIR
jgi:hypothetical protein